MMNSRTDPNYTAESLSWHMAPVGRLVRFFLILVIACLQILLSGCYDNIQRQYTERNLSAIHRGSTTRAEVIALLGEAEFLDTDGYFLTEVPSSGTPLNVLIEFDDRNIVRRIETTGEDTKSAPVTESQMIDTRMEGQDDIAALVYQTSLLGGAGARSVDFSPDGRWLAGEKLFQTSVYIWDFQKKQLDTGFIPTFYLDPAVFKGFSMHGPFMQVEIEGQKTEWNLGNGAISRIAKPNNVVISGLSPDGEKIVALKIHHDFWLGTSRYFVILDKSGNELMNLSDISNYYYPISNPRFLPHGKFVIAVLCRINSNCYLKLWDAVTGQEFQSIRTSHRVGVTVWGLNISSDGTLVATWGFDKERDSYALKLWSLPEGKLLGEQLFPRKNREKQILKELPFFFPDGRLVTVINPGFILVWNLDKHPGSQSAGTDETVIPTDALSRIDSVLQLPYGCFQTKLYHTQMIFLTTEGKLGVECAHAGAVIFDVNTNKLEWNFVAPPYYERPRLIPGSSNRRYIYDISLNPDLKQLAMATDKGIFLFEIPPVDNSLKTP